MQQNSRLPRRAIARALSGRPGLREHLLVEPTRARPCSVCGGAQCQVSRFESGPRPAIGPSRPAGQSAQKRVTPASAEEVISTLGLAPHPEGGFYRETFRSEQRVQASSSGAPRAASTAIYFLLKAGDFSAFHRVKSDEVWHHYCGASLELHTIDPAGRHQRVELGENLLHGERPQWVVGAGVLQAARVIGSGFVLCGCTVAPGFEFADFSMPSRPELQVRFPALTDLIETFTR